jgi:hypothetical protein
MLTPAKPFDILLLEVDITQFIDAITTLGNYWFALMRLPKE